MYLLLKQFGICDLVHRENDTGVFSYKEHLPVQEIVIGDTYRLGSEAVYAVGPLQCSGDSTLTDLFCCSVIRDGDGWLEENDRA